MPLIKPIKPKLFHEGVPEVAYSSIGLDLSLTGSGVACATSNKGVWKITSTHSIGWPPALKGKSSFTKAAAVCDAVMKIVIAHVTLHTVPTVIVIEGLAFGNKHSLVSMVEIATMVKLRLSALGFNIVVMLCPPSVLKKFVTGTGTAPKEMMLKEAYKKFNFEFADNNENDAACLALLGLCKLDGFVMPTRKTAVSTALAKLEVLQ